MMDRVVKNYHQIIGINAGLILLGVAGMIQPTSSALFHNTSTLLISLRSMRNLLTDEKNKNHSKREIHVVCGISLFLLTVFFYTMSNIKHHELLLIFQWS